MSSTQKSGPDRPIPTDLASITKRLDVLSQAYLTLASELWIIIDRQIVLEQTLIEAGISEVRNVQTVTPENELKVELDQRRKSFALRITDALSEHGPAVKKSKDG